MFGLTTEQLASAIGGLLTLLTAIGVYNRTKAGPSLAEGAYKIQAPGVDSAKQLERIAQALEDIAAQGKDSFQRDTRDKLEKIEEIMEAFERSRSRDRDDDRESRRREEEENPRGRR